MPRPQHVLIVDELLADTVQLVADLVSNGFQVTHVETAARAIHHANALRLDFIIAETTIVDLDGWTLCTRLRQWGFQKPFLMLSHVAGPEDVVRALNCGADDYLAKPYPLASLLARLRAHARSYYTNSEATQDVGTLKYFPRRRAVTNAGLGRPARLTGKEAALFGSLYRADGEPLDRKQLMQEIWGGHPDIESHAIEAMIYRLRQKIEPNPSKPAFLVKVSEGYCLVDPATRQAGRTTVYGRSLKRVAA